MSDFAPFESRGRRPARSEVWAAAWPAILEMTLHTLVWTADTAMVGRLGPEALTAVGMGAQFLWTATFFFGAIGVATTSMVSRSVGAGDPETARRFTEQAYILGIALGLLVWALTRSLSRYGFILARAEPEVVGLGVAYVKLAAPGALFAIPLFVSNASLRSWGNVRMPLVAAATANVANVILDYLLIFGLAGFPPMGVRGAAVATTVAQAIGLAAASAAVFGSRRGVPGRLLKLSRGHVEKLVKVAVPAALETLMTDGARMVGAVMIGALGTIPFAANEVAVAAESISFMPGYGFGVAAGALVGRSLGAKNPKAARKRASETMRLCVMTMGLAGIAFLLVPGFIVRLFTPEEAVIRAASTTLRIAALEQPAIAIAEVTAGALRGAGRTHVPMKVAALSAWGIRVPLVYLSVRVLGLGLPWVWGVIVLESIVKAALLLRHAGKGLRS